MLKQNTSLLEQSMTYLNQMVHNMRLIVKFYKSFNIQMKY